MKAVIAVPPVFDFYFTPHRFSGLGSEILLNLLIDHGWEAILMNFPCYNKRGNKQDLPAALNYLRPYIIEDEVGRVSYFSKYQRFGPPVSECAAQILLSKPDLIFISCFAFCYAHVALELAKRIRKIQPTTPIIVGGAGVSAYPEQFIRHPAIDFAFIGEAEVSIPLFLNIVKSGSDNFACVPNLYYKKMSKVVFPAIIRRTSSKEILFVFKKTFEDADRIDFTTTLSRGCPKQCRFCSNFLSHGRQFRTIPIHIIKEYLADIRDPHNQPPKKISINFEDDNLLCDPAYFLSVLEIFKTRFQNAVFLAENGIDYTLITPDLLKTLIQYGIGQFNISMATVDPHTLEHEKRPSALRRHEEILNILKKNHIPSITYFICGLKHESKEQVAADIAYLAGRPTRLGISLFYPVPGISDYQDRAFFDDIPSYLCAGSSAYPWNQSLSTGEMVTAFRLSRLVNLMKSKIRSEADDLLIQKTVAEQKLYTMVKNGRTRKIIEVPDMDNDIVKLFFKKVRSGFEKI